MSFWEDLSPSVKRYLAIAAFALIALIAARSCLGPEVESEPPPRGAKR